VSHPDSSSDALHLLTEQDNLVSGLPTDGENVLAARFVVKHASNGVSKPVRGAQYAPGASVHGPSRGLIHDSQKLVVAAPRRRDMVIHLYLGV
jgi:hypothetical protein